MTTPVTGVGFPSTVVETYSTRYTVPSMSGAATRSDFISVPGLVGIGSENE